GRHALQRLAQFRGGLRQVAGEDHQQRQRERERGIDEGFQPGHLFAAQAEPEAVAVQAVQTVHRSSVRRQGRCYTAAMFHATSLSGDKPAQYAQLAAQARALLAGEPDRVANAANLSALVYHALPSLNWVGFYFFDGNELVVGPFQG